MKFSKNTALRINNILLYLGFAFLIGSGLLLVFRLPPCSRGGGDFSMLDISRHEWGDLHFYVGLGVVALMVVHLALNWPWMKKIAAKGGTWKLWSGLLAGVVIAGSFFVAPVVAEDEDDPCHGCDGSGCSESVEEGGGCGGCEEEEEEGCGDCEGCDEEDADGATVEDAGECGDCEGCDESDAE